MPRFRISTGKTPLLIDRLRIYDQHEAQVQQALELVKRGVTVACAERATGISSKTITMRLNHQRISIRSALELQRSRAIQKGKVTKQSSTSTKNSNNNYNRKTKGSPTSNNNTLQLQKQQQIRARRRASSPLPSKCKHYLLTTDDPTKLYLTFDEELCIASHFRRLISSHGPFPYQLIGEVLRYYVRVRDAYDRVAEQDKEEDMFLDSLAPRPSLAAISESAVVGDTENGTENSENENENDDDSVINSNVNNTAITNIATSPEPLILISDPETPVRANKRSARKLPAPIPSPASSACNSPNPSFPSVVATAGEPTKSKSDTSNTNNTPNNTNNESIAGIANIDNIANATNAASAFALAGPPSPPDLNPTSTANSSTTTTPTTTSATTNATSPITSFPKSTTTKQPFTKLTTKSSTNAAGSGVGAAVGAGQLPSQTHSVNASAHPPSTLLDSPFSRNGTSARRMSNLSAPNSLISARISKHGISSVSNSASGSNSVSRSSSVSGVRPNPVSRSRSGSSSVSGSAPGSGLSTKPENSTRPRKKASSFSLSTKRSNFNSLVSNSLVTPLKEFNNSVAAASASSANKRSGIRKGSLRVDGASVGIAPATTTTTTTGNGDVVSGSGTISELSDFSVCRSKPKPSIITIPPPYLTNFCKRNGIQSQTIAGLYKSENQGAAAASNMFTPFPTSSHHIQTNAFVNRQILAYADLRSKLVEVEFIQQQKQNQVSKSLQQSTQPTQTARLNQQQPGSISSSSTTTKNTQDNASELFRTAFMSPDVLKAMLKNISTTKVTRLCFLQSGAEKTNATFEKKKQQEEEEDDELEEELDGQEKGLRVSKFVEEEAIITDESEDESLAKNNGSASASTKIKAKANVGSSNSSSTTSTATHSTRKIVNNEQTRKIVMERISAFLQNDVAQFGSQSNGNKNGASSVGAGALLSDIDRRMSLPSVLPTSPALCKRILVRRYSSIPSLGSQAALGSQVRRVRQASQSSSNACEDSDDDNNDVNIYGENHDDENIFEEEEEGEYDNDEEIGFSLESIREMVNSERRLVDMYLVEPVHVIDAMFEYLEKFL